MEKPKKEVDRERPLTGSVSGADLRAPTLLPMLIGGMVLIVVAMLIVVYFV